MNKVYARVINNVITEFPVLEDHIKSRNHPINWYTLCTETIRPKISEFQYLTDEPHVLNGGVTIEYKVHDFDLQYLLNKVADKDQNTGKLTAKVVGLIDRKYIEQIKTKAIEHAQIKLDNFARARGYYNAESAITYNDSTIERFKDDAIKVKVTRDNLWVQLHKYVADIESGVVPFPVTISDIEEVFPEMTW